jgi:hypothetical protein
MELIGEQTWKELLQACGKNVEDVGRMLRREQAFTDQDLENLQVSLKQAVNTIQIIRERAAEQV